MSASESHLSSGLFHSQAGCPNDGFHTGKAPENGTAGISGKPARACLCCTFPGSHCPPSEQSGTGLLRTPPFPPPRPGEMPWPCVLFFSTLSICIGNSGNPGLLARHCAVNTGLHLAKQPSVTMQNQKWSQGSVFHSPLSERWRQVAINHTAASTRLLSFGHGPQSQGPRQSILANQIQQLYYKDDTGEQGTKVYSSSHVSTILKKRRKKMSADCQMPKIIHLSVYRSVCLSIQISIQLFTYLYLYLSLSLILFKLHHSPVWKLELSLFSGEETKAQRSQEICPRSHSQ